MPNKTSSIYVCSSCDAQFPKWSGRCLECGSWGTLVLKTIDEREKNKLVSVAAAETIPLEDVKIDSLNRIKIGISEVDRVLGGGLVPGSLILLAGEPGIGKSTILLQMADSLIKNNGQQKVIYVSGEESAAQIKERLTRLDCRSTNVLFVTDTNVEKIIAAAKKENPTLLIIDSIQTVYSTQVVTEPGSLNQIRASTVGFLELAKESDITIILIGHITKDGQIAGPKSLEHIVDTVIYLESDPSLDYRILRATKNRFGSVNEVGIFTMTTEGFKEVKNPAGIFIENKMQSISGSALSAVMEGTRPFLIEVQALVTKTVFGYPQRRAAGFDLNRLQVLAAVLTKRANINLLNQDVILNIVGGFKINDPALDLAVCLAIASSLLNQTIGRETIILGEVGLGGEVRNVNKLKERLSEATKLGIKKAIIPDINIKFSGIELIKLKNINEISQLVTRNL